MGIPWLSFGCPLGILFVCACGFMGGCRWVSWRLSGGKKIGCVARWATLLAGRGRGLRVWGRPRGGLEGGLVGCLVGVLRVLVGALCPGREDGLPVRPVLLGAPVVSPCCGSPAVVIPAWRCVVWGSLGTYSPWWGLVSREKNFGAGVAALWSATPLVGLPGANGLGPFAVFITGGHARLAGSGLGIWWKYWGCWIMGLG